MYQVISKSADATTLPLPIPGGTPEGAFQVKMLNNDAQFGPTVYLLTLAPGSRIPAHLHKKATETFMFLEGDFIDNGTTYDPGTYFACEPNTVHGPHSTVNGATLLVFQTQEVDASDFFLADVQPDR